MLLPRRERIPETPDPTGVMSVPPNKRQSHRFFNKWFFWRIYLIRSLSLNGVGERGSIMSFSLRRRRTVSDILLTLFAGLIVFGLSWYHLTHSPTTVSLRLFLILWIVCFCLIAAELVAAVRRSVVLDGGEIVIRSGVRPACVLPLCEIDSIALTREAAGKRVRLFRRYGKAHRSGADSLILTCRDGRRYRLAVEYHQKFYEEVVSRLK